MKTAGIYFLELCDEIDYWKAEAERWKMECEDERKARAELLNSDMESAKRGVGMALMLAMSIQDNEDGSISISKENRKELAEKL